MTGVTSGLWGLAWRSAWSRRFVLALTVLSVALASFLLTSIERVRADVAHSFTQAVSGTDLIVGARSGSLQLLLYSVFRVGQASHNIRLDSLEVLHRHRAVAWVVPLSLGDSHRSFPVVGTVSAYFDHFRHGDDQALRMAEGRRFEGLHDVVLGARWPVGLDTGWAASWFCPMVTGRSKAPTMTTIPFRSWASWRPPAPRSTVRCTSAWTRWMPCTRAAAGAWVGLPGMSA